MNETKKRYRCKLDSYEDVLRVMEEVIKAEYKVYRGLEEKYSAEPAGSNLLREVTRMRDSLIRNLNVYVKFRGWNVLHWPKKEEVDKRTAMLKAIFGDRKIDSKEYEIPLRRHNSQQNTE